MALLTTTRVVTTTLLLITTWAIIDYSRRVRRNSTIPGPRPLPFVGNMFSVLAYTRRQNVHTMFTRLQAMYGNIFRLSFPGERFCVFIADPDTAHQVLLTPDAFVKGDIFQRNSAGVFKYALFAMPTDDTWRAHRKCLVPCFDPSHLQHGAEITNKVVNTLLDRWATLLNNKKTSTSVAHQTVIVDMFQVFTCIAIDVIGQFAFSFDYECVRQVTTVEEQSSAAGSIKEYLSVADFLSRRMGVPPLLWPLMGVARNKAAIVTKPIKATIQRAIDEKRRKQNKQDEKSHAKTVKAEKAMDVLDRLLASTTFSDEEFQDELMALFLAGGETSANTMVWCALMLDAHVDVRKKLEEELDAILGPPGSTPTRPFVSNDDLKQLPYLDAVVKETMRCHPVVRLLVGRRALRNVTLMGHHIEKDTLVQVVISGLHSSQQCWKDPDRFLPDRWLTAPSSLTSTSAETPDAINNAKTNQTKGKINSLDVATPVAFLPFGDGPHKCIGFRLAMIEIKTTLALICREYRMRVVHGQDLTPVTSISYGLKRGLHVALEPRRVAVARGEGANSK